MKLNWPIDPPLNVEFDAKCRTIETACHLEYRIPGDRGWVLSDECVLIAHESVHHPDKLNTSALSYLISLCPRDIAQFYMRWCLGLSTSVSSTQFDSGKHLPAVSGHLGFNHVAPYEMRVHRREVLRVGPSVGSNAVFLGYCSFHSEVGYCSSHFVAWNLRNIRCALNQGHYVNVVLQSHRASPSSVHDLM